MKRIEIKSDADLANAIADIESWAEADAETSANVESSVREIVQAVKLRGDTAVAEFTSRFDKVDLDPTEFEISLEQADDIAKAVDPSLISALKRAHDNIRRFHEKNLRQSWEETQPDGTILGQRITPIERVGLYVPGGKAFYPSSVLMNIVPAAVAGVKDIVMVSPPSYEGGIHPLVLAAARIAGANRIFRVGGAQSIAALAYGTEMFPKVDKIAGPGNVFVTVAKRLVSNVCDIDKEAGPSEVLVIADGSADPRFAAVEMLAQSEHDEEACSILITTSNQAADAILQSMEAELATLSRAEIIRTALAQQGRVYVVRDEDDAVALANTIASEHMAVQTADPKALFERITNVGCAVIGAGTSVAVGDYFAGPNHVLPTGRRARFASPLTAEDFRKVSSILAYGPDALRDAADDIIRLAKAEELTAHARAVEVRK